MKKYLRHLIALLVFLKLLKTGRGVKRVITSTPEYLHVRNEVVVPATKTALEEIVSESISVILYGPPRKRTTTPHSVDYRRMANQRRQAGARRNQPGLLVSSDCYTVFLTDGNEAEELRHRIEDFIGHFTCMSVNDLRDLLRIPKPEDSSSDDTIGWSSAEGVYHNPIDAGTGYSLTLPIPHAL